MANKRTVTTLPVTEKTVGNGNWDKNRSPIDLLIIHTIVGKLPAADARFNIPNEQASVHYGIGYDGSIWHWVDEDKTAYQAGNYEINKKSIGIEHEDNGLKDGVYDDGARPDLLYATSAKLIADICNFYSIPIDREHIKKHSEVSDKPTACPDALDIERIVTEARVIANAVEEPADLPKKIRVITDRGLNGRSESSTNGKIVNCFEKGVVLDVLSKQNGESINDNPLWYGIKNKKETIFVWSGGVEIIKEEVIEEEKPKEEVKEDKDKIISDLKKENTQLVESMKVIAKLASSFIPKEETKGELDQNILEKILTIFKK